MSKQTAVQWLVEQVNSDCLNSAFIRPELVKEALRMEEEQRKTINYDTKPSQKAESMLRNMTVDFSIDLWQSKQCAIKACEEILQLPFLSDADVEYWQEVLIELERITG